MMKTGWFWDRWRGGLVNKSDKLYSIHLLAPQKRIECLYHHSSDCVAILFCIFFSALSQAARQVDRYLLGVVGAGDRFGMVVHVVSFHPG